MGLNDIHNILFNAHILFSLAMGIWAAVIAARTDEIPGGYWGAIATITMLAGATLLVGVLMLLQGLRPRDGRTFLYILYMLWLIVIVPGVFSLLRGQDDRRAALAFSFVGFFNAATSASMVQRGLAGDWDMI